MPVRAELVFVGTEVVLGEIVNTHAAYLGRSLAAEGVRVARATAVPDDPAEAAAVLREALARADLVVCTGGLGPTTDDVTRQALAEATGRPLREDPASRAAIQAYLERRGLPATEAGARQALLPDGAEPLPNPYGTAPGIALEHGGRLLLCLPGPARELQPMWEEHGLPRVRSFRGRRGEAPVRLFRRVLRVAGLPESVVEERLQDLFRPGADPEVAPYVQGFLEVHLRLRTRAAVPEEAEARLEAVERRIRERLGVHVYGRDDETLPAAVGALLRARGLRLALAESCTGGLIGHLITSVPGSSAYFLGSLVAYDDAVKRGVLGVPAEVLRRHGAVSEETARAMAAGAMATTGADVGLAVTGIAGPGGGTPEKPVGTVWLCVRDRERTLARRFWFPGVRAEVQERAAGLALALLRGFLLGLPDGGVL